MTQILKLSHERIEYIVGKGENAGYSVISFVHNVLYNPFLNDPVLLGQCGH